MTVFIDTRETKMTKFTRTLVLGILALPLMYASSGFAAQFANQFCQFELPPQWQCSLEGAEWVCQSTVESKKKDAIIVLAAKLKGDQDSLDQYLAYLKGAKTWNTVQGKPVKSEVKYAKTQDINGQVWVDSLHLESEIPGFYTRYLATIKQDIGVLVTYSINKNKYQQYTGDFENMVKTLRVFRKAGGVNQGPQGNIFQNTTIPQGLDVGTVFPGVNPQGGSDQAPQQKKDNSLGIYAAAAVLVLYVIWRRRRSGGG